MKHFPRKYDLHRIRRTVFFAAPTVPAFVFVFDHGNFLRIQTIDNISGAELVAERATFDAEILVNQYGH
jgi:hypothetical protein